jgi:hypothetical protein
MFSWNKESTLQLYFFIPFFIGLWCFVSLLFSVLSGWHGAAGIYRNNSEVPENTFNFQSARINLIDYNGCLIFGVNNKGLIIKVMVLFRLGNPTLFIPWEDILVKDSSGFLFNGKLITFKRYDEMKVRISNRLAERLFKEHTMK